MKQRSSRGNPAAGSERPGRGAEPWSDDDLESEIVDAGSREHYADAALYDYEYRRRRADVTFYRKLARERFGGKPGEILELGAGSGRVTVPLARDGHEVLALDRSEPMLAKLRARAAALPASVSARIQTARADLRGFRAGRKFPLAIAAFNVLEHLYTRGELAACLRTVADHLAPGGAFVFDVQMPDMAWLLRDPEKRWAKTRFTDPSTGKACFYSTNHEYDPVSQIALIRIYYDEVTTPSGTARAASRGASRVVKLTQRKYFPAELEALVAHAGYRVVARYGDFIFGPLTGSSETQVLVCEPVPAPSPIRRRKLTRSR